MLSFSLIMLKFDIIVFLSPIVRFTCVGLFIHSNTGSSLDEPQGGE